MIWIPQLNLYQIDKKTSASAAKTRSNYKNLWSKPTLSKGSSEIANSITQNRVKVFGYSILPYWFWIKTSRVQWNSAALVRLGPKAEWGGRAKCDPRDFGLFPTLILIAVLPRLLTAGSCFLKRLLNSSFLKTLFHKDIEKS